MNKKEFTKAFLKNKKMIGAVRPSSRFLVRAMLQNINFRKAKTIIELGPGTGVFTEELLRKMSSDSKLLVFELNEEFILFLKQTFKDPRVTFIHESAERINHYLTEHNLKQADYIVSSLPLANFSDELRENIIQAGKENLSLKRKFLQFQYSLQSRSFLKNHFKNVKTSLTLWNIPPAFVFVCTQ